MKQNPRQIQAVLNELARLARELGATGAKAISTREISVEADLAALCRNPRCGFYGLSAGCPPHVSGPPGFRKLLPCYDHAVFLKIDVPSEILLSDQRSEIFKLLHEIVARVERAAVECGYVRSRAFAGGSCKDLFCRDHPSCRVLAEGGPCRNPDRARPSMSGFGINVSALMQAAGWRLNRITRQPDPDAVSMGTVSGLVLIG